MQGLTKYVNYRDTLSDAVSHMHASLWLRNALNCVSEAEFAIMRTIADYISS